MKETFVDPETGWSVTRETVNRSGVDLVADGVGFDGADIWRLDCAGIEIVIQID